LVVVVAPLPRFVDEDVPMVDVDDVPEFVVPELVLPIPVRDVPVLVWPVLWLAVPLAPVPFEVAPAGVLGDVADVAPAGVPCEVPVVADPLTPGVLVLCVPLWADGLELEAAPVCGPMVPVPLAPVLPAPVLPVDVCAAAIPTASSTLPANKVTRIGDSP
jgi:hypothetical protein